MKGTFRSAALALVVLAACHGDSPASRMRAIAARGGRTVEARLTGFAWSPIRVQRGTPALDPARLELAGAAGAVIEQNPGGRDAGVGYLIIDRDAEAVEALQDAAQQSPNDAKVWSDLAAARYTLAARGDKPYELPRALAAADHALRLTPTLPDALFNRALIIERLGISEAARRAWQRYLQADGTSKWADEALGHLGRLDVVNTRAQFERELARARAALANGDAAPIAAIARTFPQEARTWGEGPLLAEWADAVHGDDSARAQQVLALVRAIGHALVESNHEQLLSDAVAWIDGNPSRQQTIAQAQIAYRDGRILYSKRKIAEGLPLISHSADLFQASGSPMALVARYYAANALYDMNRVPEATAALNQLAAQIDPHRYRGLDAQITWELALCQITAGEWERAIQSMDAAGTMFGALGETNNHAQIDMRLADALDQVAQPRAAWIVRLRAIPEYSRGDVARMRTGLAAAIRPAAERRQFDVALALSKIVLEDLQDDQNPIALSEASIDRVRLFNESDDAASAREAAASARGAIARIPDAALRARASVRLQVEEAAMMRASNPAAAMASLDQALQFLGGRDEHAPLPDIYLQRGRTNAAMGNDAGALADFENGIRELHALRARFSQDQFRSDFYDTKSDLFTETIALLLRRGDVARAFTVADEARGRTLTEQLGPLPEDQPLALATLGGRVAPDAAVLEYVLLKDSVAIFYASRTASGVQVVPADTVSLQASIERFDDSIQRRRDLTAVQRDAATLHRLLVKPVLPRLHGIAALVVIPDQEVNSLPFSSLYDADSHRYLVEDFVIAVAPSARYLLRPAKPLSLTPALVIGDPKSDSGPTLPEAAREAQAIASMYPATTFLAGDRATRARFIESAERSGMIHYAGHAQSDALSSSSAVHLAADDTHTNGDLDADDIARLHLRHSPLVVLAACGTIRGDASHVEGMPSIARAFLAAGARGVIGTLWEIDDNTAAGLFRRLHQQLRAGIMPAAALRNAQLALLRSGDPQLQHPTAWAPIEILGREN